MSDRTLIVDSREKWTQPRNKDRHIRNYFDRHGIAYKVEKLDVGDYMFEGGSVTVDRKRSVDEISENLTNPADKARFWREVRLAAKLGLRLVVLIESNKYRRIQDLATWRSKYSAVGGRVLLREMERLRLAYGVEFRIAPKVSAAKTIIEILKNYN